MKRAKRGPTFADIVAEERAKPVPEPEPRRPGMYGSDGELVGPDGTVYAYAADASRERAAELAAAGALLAADHCGCKGMCGIQWLAPEAIRDGIPERDRKYDWPGYELYVADDGRVALLFTGPMRWSPDPPPTRPTEL